MNTINKGSIWQGTKWGQIFEHLTDKKYNPYKNWWIEKVYISNSDSLLADDIFSHYQLACEHGYKNKIPAKFNEFIKSTFKDDRHITEKKYKEV